MQPPGFWGISKRWSGRGAVTCKGGEKLVDPIHCSDRRAAQELWAGGEPGASFKVGHDGYTLTLTWTQARESAILGFELEPLELALLLESPLIVLLYRLGSRASWAHVPYAWPLSDGAPGAHSLVPVRLAMGQHTRLRLRLQETSSGRVLAERLLQLDTDFSAALRIAIAAQVSTPFDGHAYMRALISLILDGGDLGRMLPRAAARTTANDQP
jgi:hypothetical protein